MYLLYRQEFQAEEREQKPYSPASPMSDDRYNENRGSGDDYSRCTEMLDPAGHESKDFRRYRIESAPANNSRMLYL